MDEPKQLQVVDSAAEPSGSWRSPSSRSSLWGFLGRALTVGAAVCVARMTFANHEISAEKKWWTSMLIVGVLLFRNETQDKIVTAVLDRLPFGRGRNS